MKKREGGEGMGAWQSPLQEEGDGGLARKKNSSCHMSPLDECPAIGGHGTPTRAREASTPGIRPPFEERRRRPPDGGAEVVGSGRQALESGRLAISRTRPLVSRYEGHGGNTQ